MRLLISILSLLPSLLFAQLESGPENKYAITGGNISLTQTGNSNFTKRRIDFSLQSSHFIVGIYNIAQDEKEDNNGLAQLILFPIPLEETRIKPLEYYDETGVLFGVIKHAKPFQFYAQLGLGKYKSLERGKLLEITEYKGFFGFGSSRTEHYESIEKTGLAIPMKLGTRVLAWGMLGVGLEYQRNWTRPSKYQQLSLCFSVGLNKW